MSIYARLRELAAAPAPDWKEREALKREMHKLVPELKYFQHAGPRPAKTVQLKRGDSYVEDADPHHWMSASTHLNSLGNPITLPGDDLGTGIAVKANPIIKRIYFSEINSHVKGAGARMVDAVIRTHPGWKFAVTDWSRASDGNYSGPSFWDKVKRKYPGRFADE